MTKRSGHSLTFIWPIFSCWSYYRDILETIIFESHCLNLSKIAKEHAISHLFSRRKSCLFANLYKNSCALEVCRKICKSIFFQNLLLQYYKISFINKIQMRWLKCFAKNHHILICYSMEAKCIFYLFVKQIMRGQ